MYSQDCEFSGMLGKVWQRIQMARGKPVDPTYLADDVPDVLGLSLDHEDHTGSKRQDKTSAHPPLRLPSPLALYQNHVVSVCLPVVSESCVGSGHEEHVGQAWAGDPQVGPHRPLPPHVLSPRLATHTVGLHLVVDRLEVEA